MSTLKMNTNHNNYLWTFYLTLNKQMKRISLFAVIVFSFFYLSGQTSKETLINSPHPEHYVEIKIANKTEINEISKRFSIDNLVYLPEKQCYKVTIWLHQRDFSDFLNLEIPFEILLSEQNNTKATMANSVEELRNGWTHYPTYFTYEALMNHFQNTYPAICKIDTILASTPKNHKILAAHISTTLNESVPKPNFFYSSTMHGDEAGGYYMMLRLIDYILSNQEDSKVSAILNNIDLWIAPLENPDGVYHSGNNTLGASPVSTRANANGYDLNRSYPAAFTSLGSNYQPEITAMMNFMNLHHFTMSANLHGGSELFNYVWDMYTSAQMEHPDFKWWKNTGRAFADTCHLFSANYFTNENNGVISGGDWYVITNSRQDYVNYHARCREVTLEVSQRKTPNTNELNTYWGYIKNSLLNYILAIRQGISGIVTDSLTGEPLQAKIFINNYDRENQHSEIYSQLPYGDYYRPLLAKNYTVTYSATGYYSQTCTLTVSPGESTVKNVKLLKGTTGIKNSENKIILSPNPTTGILHVTCDNSDRIEIYDVIGRKQKVEIRKHDDAKRDMVIDISHLQAGIYFLRVDSETVKVIKN
jgi:hypothetical protein